MTTIRKTITLTDQQDKWIKSRVSSGDFTNESEFIRDLLRREQVHQQQVSALQKALVVGENSGEAQPFDVTTFKQKMKQQHGGR